MEVYLSMLIYCIEKYLTPLAAMLGICGNLVSTSVLYSPALDMKKSFRHILIMLAGYDTLFSFLVLLTFPLPLVSEYYRLWILPYLLPHLLPTLQIALNGSIWSTVMVTIERYVSVGHPSQRYGTANILILKHLIKRILLLL